MLLVWPSFKGEIKISDMDTSHLQNAISFIQYGYMPNHRMHEFLSLLEKEFNRRLKS